MPEQHAPLGPSGAHRWMACPASIRMSRDAPYATSTFAEEGTCAHALGEIEARLALGTITPAEATRERNAWRTHWQEAIGLSEEQEEEMANHVAAYVAFIMERAAAYPNSVVMLEQRLPTGVPSCWGTSDAVIVSPEHVEIVDLKYGAGKFVVVVGNPQTRLYGVGALEAYGDIIGEPQQVIMTVFQPRMDNIASETMTPEDLRAWRDSVVPLAELALSEDAPFNPGEEQCEWCPARGMCRAQMEWATRRDFGQDADTLSPEELADALAMVPAITSWCEDVKKVAMAMATGGDLPGYKIVRSNGRRYITDHEAAISALTAMGHALDAVSTRKAKGIGDLERLLGKEKFAEVLGPWVAKSEGSPSLATEDDARPAIDRNAEAAKEFGE